MMNSKVDLKIVFHVKTLLELTNQLSVSQSAYLLPHSVCLLSVCLRGTILLISPAARDLLIKIHAFLAVGDISAVVPCC